MYPLEIATNLEDLIRFEYMVQAGHILPDRSIYSLLTGRHAAKMRGRGLDFEEVRQYVPGDDIRNIDWRVTARTGTTYSKVFNEEKERPTFILLDQSAKMFFGSQRYVKSVSAAHIAALAAFYTIKRGDRFGGLVFNEQGHDYLAPKRSKSLVQNFLQLTTLRNQALPLRENTVHKSGLFNEMLQRTQISVTHDYVICVITNVLNIDQDGKMYLKTMQLHNNIILIHIEDPMDSLLPEGKLVLSNGDRQILWNNRNKDWGEKYTADYQRRLMELREEFRRYGTPVSVYSTATPVEDQLKTRMGAYLRA